MKSGKGEKTSRLFRFDVLYRILFIKKTEPMAPFFWPYTSSRIPKSDFNPANFSVESEALLCNNSAGRTGRAIESQKRQLKGKSSWVSLGLRLDSKV